MHVSLTEQDTKIIGYLQSRNLQDVAWEELAQFSKEPTTVKLNTIKKAVSEIKKCFLNERAITLDIQNQPISE